MYVCTCVKESFYGKKTLNLTVHYNYFCYLCVFVATNLGYHVPLHFLPSTFKNSDLKRKKREIPENFLNYLIKTALPSYSRAQPASLWYKPIICLTL